MDLLARPVSTKDEERGSKEVSTMAATIDIEVESGIYTQPVRKHRGYYAGDFSARPLSLPDASA
jgi:hypothetical protein